jgi:hypothetical protein
MFALFGGKIDRPKQAAAAALIPRPSKRFSAVIFAA